MQISIFDGEKELKIDKPIRLIELFAGIGAQAKALQNIGADFERYRVCEFDKSAIKSYNAVHGTSFKAGDILEWKAEDIGIYERDKYCYIMTYSFPCQDLSMAGKRAGMKVGTQSGLLWEVERLLMEAGQNLPHILLMENVPAIHWKENVKDFYKWMLFLEGIGYKNYQKDLSATRFGIPQTRVRCFMVSVLGDYFYGFPKGKELEKTAQDFLDKNVESKYFLTEEQEKKIRMSGYKNNRRRVGGQTVRTLCATDYSHPALLQLSDAEEESTDSHMFDTVEVDGGGRRMKKMRKLTPREYWRLMGFSDEDFEKASKAVSATQLYKQAGNSIVVPVLEAIFKKMIGEQE